MALACRGIINHVALAMSSRMRHNKGVLIIEDDPDYSQLVTTVLARSGSSFDLRTALTLADGLWSLGGANTMRVVLTGRWGRGRHTNLQQLPKTNSGTVIEKGDRSPVLYVSLGTHC
jgi:hypothetical protein